jgi:hypothetical protein
MSRTHRVSAAGALIICLLGAPVFANEDFSQQLAEPSPSALHEAAPTYVQGRLGPLPSATRPLFTISDQTLANAVASAASADALSLAQRGRYRGRRSRWDDNGPARTAIILGGVASIAGAAILVYANRPECRTNQLASGCGYGSKVVGGAVLSGGLVSITLGAVTWR